MKTNQKSEDFVRLGSIISRTLKNCRGESEEVLKIWSLWESVVGEAIAENARPAAFKEKLLLVNVSDPIWIQQLQFLKADMIAKINEALGKNLIEDIKFKVGPVDD
ncbi:DUF721 domain-containing protein [Desulfobacterales bacterium HSG2]|nr:DUF721 domain-containing protein [Desulfobacterales bacterium HSG2]